MPTSDIPPLYTLLADTPPCYDADEALREFNALSDIDKAKLSKGMASAASREDAKVEFEKASTSAAAAVQNIDTMFTQLQYKILTLGFDAEQFVSPFTDIHNSFRDITVESHSLANDIAQYAESFDKIIIKFCADSSISVEERRTKIKKFIAEADDFKLAASATKDNFTNLIDQFTGFASSFSHWAEAQEAADRTQIEALNKEIAKLAATIAELRGALLAMAGVMGITLIATGLLSIFFPVALAWGVGIAGLELTSVAGIGIAIAVLENERATDLREVQRLGDEIDRIESARADLQKAGEDDLKIFHDNISILGQTWEDVRLDAEKIQGWLDEGADYANYPEYMKESLEEGVQIYTRMAQYLENYAHGVTETLKKWK